MSTQPKPSPPQPRTCHWIDVRDHMPDDWITVLIAAGCTVVTAWRDDGRWWKLGNREPCRVRGVTHWMDLPEPPTP